MPAKHPRITITLHPEDHATLRRLAKIQGGSMSSILREFIHETAPVLDTLADTLEAAQRAEASAAIRFKAAAQKAEEDLRPLADMIRNQFELFADEVQGKLDAREAEEELEEPTPANQRMSG